MKTDLFQSCGHCWAFQICWHIEWSTFTASSVTKHMLLGASTQSKHTHIFTLNYLSFLQWKVFIRELNIVLMLKKKERFIRTLLLGRRGMVAGQQVNVSTGGFICMSFCVISTLILLLITFQVKQIHKFRRKPEISIHQKSNCIFKMKKLISIAVTWFSSIGSPSPFFPFSFSLTVEEAWSFVL